jgi:xanthine dehydrogenase accessory factor
MSLADDVLDRAAGLRERGETFVVATVVRVDPPTSARPGDKALIAADGTLWGWIGGSCSEALVRREALHAMGDGQPRLVKISPEMAPEHEPGVVAHVSTCPSAGSLDVFIDPHLPRPLLLVIGDTPAAHTLVRLGATIGYETCAVHPGAVASDFPEADRVIGSLDLAPARLGATTWAVVATMGHYDEEAIEALLPYDVAYIGLVASRKRAATVLAVLADRGNQGLDRVRRAADSSVGGTQEEIALAVLAEIVAERQARQPIYQIALPATAIDPICGMTVEIKGAMHTVARGETMYYFCGAGCIDAFKLREGQSVSA